MLRIPFVSYGGTHQLNFELTAYPGEPQLILRDKMGYFGFVVRRNDLVDLRSWLNTVLKEEIKSET
jgi:ABC-type amino acid transport substrate-binding protein